MTTVLFTHSECCGHNPHPQHPESPARIDAVLSALEGAEFASLLRRDAPVAEKAHLLLAHPKSHVEAVLDAMSSDERYAFDGDTSSAPGSKQAVLRAVGSAVSCVDAVVSGEAKNGFCAVRPPGHHAEADRVMGFCFFNTVAIAAYHAREKHGLQRIAVVDFDVHHGNGTQAIFWSDRDLFYGSTHQAPFYPGSGAVNETGVGNIVNAPLMAGTGSHGFRDAFEQRIMPALDSFAPDLLLISAGFDAHRNDPLGGLELETEDFSWATERLCAAAEQHCQSRVVSVLEGGYDLEALGHSAAAHVRTLMSA